MSSEDILKQILEEIQELNTSSGDDYFDDGYYVAVGDCMDIIEKYITNLKDEN